ncbi:MAG: serine hydrolase domain-containing protein [Telluria sp.]
MRMWFTLALGAALMAGPAARADQVDDYLRAQMALNHVPGAAVAIVRDGQVVKLQAYGEANLEWHAAATTDTMFQLASSTKPFTGMLLLRLQQAGKLKLDESIGVYLKDIPAAWQPITVRMLANHSSGIPDNVPSKPTLDEYVKAAQAMPLVHAPGASAEYGIGGYIVMEKVIEVVSGMPYTAALQRYVLEPLGLRHTAFENATGSAEMRSIDVLPHRASIYDWKDGRYQNFTFQFGAQGYDAGGLLTSAEDLAKVAVALDGRAFLTQASLDAMWQRQTLGNGKQNGFGAGWAVREVNGRLSVGHSGGPALSDVLHFPKERMTFVVLTNGQALYPYLAQGVSELYLPPPPVVVPKGIADTRPAVTDTVRAVLRDGLAGKVNADHFSPAGQQQFIEPFKQFLLPFFHSLDALDELVLLSEEKTPHGIGRKYFARHGKKAVTWGFDLDQDGKINGFGPN